MTRVRLIHWNAREAKGRANRLAAAGYEVESDPLTPVTLRAVTRNPPAAVVIDLSRLPTQGRDVAIRLRHQRRTRHIPIVMVGGTEEKLERIREQLPDVVYTQWSRVRSALKKAMANPPAQPRVPDSVLAGYSGTPLPKKLGIKPGAIVVLVGAPAGFEGTLGELPDGATVRRRLAGRYDLIIWFPRAKRDLANRIAGMAGKVKEGGMWIAWPKKASGAATDLTQAEVRAAGLGNGLVDYKICAIDETYSGLKFARRGEG